MDHMCGRYSLDATPEELVEAFALAEAIAFEPRYNIAPTQEIPVVRAHPVTGQRRITWLRWGLTPRWWTEPRPIINARGETLERKFQRAFHKRRCLVPATGFYEWQKLGGAKQPFHIQRHDRKLFAFAGIWERYRDDLEKDSTIIDACAIVTTAPNKILEPLHDRMPVILDPSAYATWLDPLQGASDPLSRLVAPAPDELLTAYPVSSRVNRTANDDQACVEPLARHNELFDEELF